MTTHDRIEINPEIMGAKPVIRGAHVCQSRSWFESSELA